MKRLMLLRHAKSLMGEPGQSDRDRALSQRGFRDAQAMARMFASHPQLPDRILCSSSRRTRETLAALLPHLDTNTHIIITDNVYEDETGDYIDVIGDFGDEANVLLVIGHNPTMQATAELLTGEGDPDARARMAVKFPTAALAILDFRGGDWSGLEPGSGTLNAFIRPGDLELTVA